MHAGNVTGTEIMEFLAHLMKEIDSNMVMLWNNGRPHHRKDVKQLLYDSRERLCTTRFPPYASELNPDEQMWTVPKYQELSNWYPGTVEETKISVKDVMSRLKKHPERLGNAMAQSRLPLPSIRAC